jgi:two-component system response regulator
VEDDGEDAESFERALRSCQLENPLHVVDTAEEAISYLRGEGRYANRSAHPLPHLLVLDGNMPNKKGMDVLHWIKQRPELDRFAIVILAGDGSSADEDMARRLGVHAYHAKPATPEELEKLVKRIGEFWLLGGEV